MNKDWFKSKTVWTSIVGLGYGAFGYLSGNLDFNTALQVVQVALSAWFIRLAVK